MERSFQVPAMSTIYQELKKAIESRDVQRVNKCISEAGKADPKSYGLQILFIRAILAGNLDVVRSLLKLRPRVTSDKKQWCPLYSAIQMTPSDAVQQTVELLLRQGIEACSFWRPEKNSLLHLTAWRAALGCHGAMSLLRHLLISGAKVNQLNEKKENALMYALRNVDHMTQATVDMLNYMLAAGVEVNTKNISKRTALHFTVRKYSELHQAEESTPRVDSDSSPRSPRRPSHVDCQCLIVQRLVDCGARINQEDFQGYTALSFHLATQNEADVSIQLVKKLCDLGANINFSTVSDGLNSLHRAAKLRSLPLLKLFQQYGADMGRENHLTDQSIWHYVLVPSWGAEPAVNPDPSGGVASVRIKECIKYLKESTDVDIDHPDQTGRTPLHHYVTADPRPERPDTEVIQYMLEQGAKYFTVDIRGDSPLTSAFLLDLQDITRQLIQHCPGLCRNYGPTAEPNPLHKISLHLAIRPLFWLPRRHKAENLETSLGLLRLLMEGGYTSTLEDVQMLNQSAISPEVLQLIESEATHVQSLSRLCRVLIRNVLWDQLHVKVDLLPVPNQIRKNLLLTNF